MNAMKIIPPTEEEVALARSRSNLKRRNVMFKADLAAIIRQAIKDQKRQGTTAIGADCLWQLVARYLTSCTTAPRGRNAAYFARQAFNEAIRDIREFSTFVYGNSNPACVI